MSVSLIERQLREATANLSEAEEFPHAETRWQPTGQTVIVQLRKVSDKIGSTGLLYRPQQDQALAQETEVFAKLLKVGPLAFRRPEDGEYYPGAPWAKPNDLVRIRHYNFDKLPADNDPAISLVIVDYLDIRAVVPRDAEAA